MRIELKNIGKRFHKKWLFRNVNEVFHSNEVIGIIGNNGSGKITFTQIIAGFLTPSEGEIIWNRQGNIEVESIWKEVAWCSPLLELPGALSVKQVMSLQFQMKAAHLTEFQPLLEELHLSAHQDKKLDDLSSGMLQRLKLLLAFNTKSSILVLDEPASHLDSKWQHWLDEKIASHSEDRLIFIASNQHPVELKRCQRYIDFNRDDLPLKGH